MVFLSFLLLFGHYGEKSNQDEQAMVATTRKMYWCQAGLPDKTVTRDLFVVCRDFFGRSAWRTAPPRNTFRRRPTPARPEMSVSAFNRGRVRVLPKYQVSGSQPEKVVAPAHISAELGGSVGHCSCANVRTPLLLSFWPLLAPMRIVSILLPDGPDA